MVRVSFILREEYFEFWSFFGLFLDGGLTLHGTVFWSCLESFHLLIKSKQNLWKRCIRKEGKKETLSCLILYHIKVVYR